MNAATTTRPRPLTTHLHLPPAPLSARLARHAVADLLARLPRVPQRAVDDALLLTSEVVTNAVLHAGTVLTVSIHLTPDCLRVEVADTSPQPPVRRRFDASATTGRGMAIVEDTAADSGVITRGDRGKTVWFEIDLAPGTGTRSPAARDRRRSPFAPTALSGSTGGSRRDAPGVTRTVLLLGVPIGLYRRAQQHVDGVLRELALIEFAREDAPARLLDLVDECAHRYAGLGDGTDAQVVWAERQGQATVDLLLRVPEDAADVALHLDQALDEVDRYCRDGRHLLSLITPPECQRFRRWYLTQLALQVAHGALPQRWRPLSA